MPKVLYQEFRDEYEYTRYPFMDRATLSSELLTLPANIFLDASFYVPGVTDSIYLSGIYRDKKKFTFTISNGQQEPVATAVTTLSDNVLTFYNEVGWKVGCLVSDATRLSFFLTLKDGTYTFYPEATQFSMRCVQPIPLKHVISIEADNTALIGDVWLVGGEGVTLREDDGCVRIDLVGEILARQLTCHDDDAIRTPRYIQTINGIGPDVHGGVVITGSTLIDNTILRVITHKDYLELKTI